MNQFKTLFVKGIFIGMSLVIPGISAGTVALITGLYVSLIQLFSSFKSDVFFKKEVFKNFTSHFMDLVPVFLGSIAGIYAVIWWIYTLIQSYTIPAYCLFSGVILASVPFLSRQMKLDKYSVGIFILSTVLTFYFSFLNSTFVLNGLWGEVWVYLSVYLSVGAMLLPGVSGSYILIIMGTYSRILEDVQSLSAVVLGYVVVGFISVMTVSKWIRYLLKANISRTMAGLTGMTLGGSIGIFPLKTKVQWVEQGEVGILFFLIGVGAVFLIHSITLIYLSRNK